MGESLFFGIIIFCSKKLVQYLNPKFYYKNQFSKKKEWRHFDYFTCLKDASGKQISPRKDKKYIPCGIRTRNLKIRSLTPYPLGQGDSFIAIFYFQKKRPWVHFGGKVNLVTWIYYKNEFQKKNQKNMHMHDVGIEPTTSGLWDLRAANCANRAFYFYFLFIFWFKKFNKLLFIQKNKNKK